MLRLLVSAHLIKWKAIVGILWLFLLCDGNCHDGPEAFFEHRLPAQTGPSLCLQQSRPFGVSELRQNRLALNLGLSRAGLTLLFSQQKLEFYAQSRAGLVLYRNTNQQSLFAGLLARKERFDEDAERLTFAGLAGVRHRSGALVLDALLELAPGLKRNKGAIAIAINFWGPISLRYDLLRDTSLPRPEEELALAWRDESLSLALGWRAARGWRIRGGFMLSSFSLELELLLHPVLPASETWSLGWHAPEGRRQ
jgi:hypothetical protein